MTEENNIEVSESGLLEGIDQDMQELSRRGIAAKRQKHLDEALRARKVTTAAFQQTELPLTDEIPSASLSSLISTLTERRRGLAENSMAFINERLARCLLSLMPKVVKRCWEEHPEVIRKCPGFHYQASAEFGNSEWLWVTPDIPAYFAQGTEMAQLCDHCLYHLIAVDRTVVRKIYHEKKLAEDQVRYADKLIKLPDQTYYSLLKKYPLWFEIVYNNTFPNKKLKYND